MDRSEWIPEGTNIVPHKQLKAYIKRNNSIGLTRFMLHVGGIFIAALLLYMTQFQWLCIPLLFIQGFMIAFLFAPLHECIHSSAFKTRKLNTIIGRICGLFIMRPFLYSKYRHIAHHTFTQHPQWDPDRVEFPKKITDYILHISTFNIWHRLLRNLIFLSMGRVSTEEQGFIPKSEIRAVISEARLMVLIYLAVIVVSIYFGSLLALYLWVLPRMLGEPLLRAFRMIEHTGMAESPNMLENTRTTISNCIVRFFYWNMTYHAEHHLYPSVPFHALPRLHERVGPHLAKVAPGVLIVHYTILKDIVNNQRQRQLTQHPTL